MSERIKQITKSDISASFKMFETYGFSVTNFNSHKAMSKGAIGMVDHLIVGKGKVYFIEVKIGKDVLSEQQKRLGRALIECTRRQLLYGGAITTFYFIATEQNYDLITEMVLRNRASELLGFTYMQIPKIQELLK